jgi:hypothetical protein
MDIIRRTLGGLFALLGLYYCVLSALTLARLPSVTTRWIQRSGDPDFKADYPVFMVWIAIGALLVGAFGCASAVKGVAAARGARDSWLALALGSPLLHWFWFLYRTVGNGVLERAAQASAQRHNGLRFGAICLAYLVMWILVRPRDAPARPADRRMQPTAASSP